MANSTRAQQVYRQLKKLIVNPDSELVPGTPLHEAELSERFKVSRTPLREALRILESEGLVEIEPRRGARTARISLEDIRIAYEAREWVESGAAEKAAQLMTAEDIKKLRKLIEAMKVSPETHEEATAAATADREFHNLIMRAAGNRLAKHLLQESRSITDRAAFFVPPGRYSESRAEHEAILKAIEQHDPEAAREAMRAHVRAAASRRFRLPRF